MLQKQAQVNFKVGFWAAIPSEGGSFELIAV
jgi:hypothetical protein